MKMYDYKIYVKMNLPNGTVVDVLSPVSGDGIYASILTMEISRNCMRMFTRK